MTYVSRGFESMRGFDIFMKVAQRIYQQFPDVVFVVVGSDRVCYGGDEKHIRHKTFREHVMAQSNYDLSKFIFTGLLPVSKLVDVLSLSDLHLYFTVPFVLSWSLMDALACGCTVLASDTAPVREMIEDGRNGLLCGFYDVDGFAARAVEVLRDPEAFRHLGREAPTASAATTRSTSRSRLARLFEETLSRISEIRNLGETRPSNNPVSRGQHPGRPVRLSDTSRDAGGRKLARAIDPAGINLAGLDCDQRRAASNRTVVPL